LLGFSVTLAFRRSPVTGIEKHEIERRLEEIERISWETKRTVENIQRLVQRLVHRLLHPHHLTIKVTGELMAIEAGSQGTFIAQLEDNGNPVNLPVGSTFAWTADDTTATIAPSADSLSAVVTVTATDTATSITITATTTDPNGASVSGSVTVSIVPGVTHTFTVMVTQS
jgi:hypothetical protein